MSQNCCTKCGAIVDYQLNDKTYIYKYKRYRFFFICRDCSVLFASLFQLKIKDDMDIAYDDYDSETGMGFELDD